MEFEWDEPKARRNFVRHRVSFHEAATIFGDAFTITFADPDHSVGEARFLSFGNSVKGRLLAVVHVARGNAIRIVSARLATRRERKIYAEG